MGQIRHGSATTTYAVRAAIQRSQASLSALSKEFGINPITVAKWRKRPTVEDQKTGPKEPRSTVLSETDEAMVVPYRIHTILTDNGIQFAEQPRNRGMAWSRSMRFDMICEANGIEHRLTKPNHPWTNGQVERMNRTIKEATVKRFHYDSHEQLRIHLNDFMAAYNFGRRLKTLKGLTPYEYICRVWTSEPEIFIINPTHQTPGLNTYSMLGGRIPQPTMASGKTIWQTGLPSVRYLIHKVCNKNQQY